VALAVVTLALVAGFDRVFLPGPWVPPLVWAGLGVHLVVAAARRLGIPAPVGALGGAVVGLQVATVSLAGDTLRRGVPTLDSLRLLGDHLERAVELWPDSRAPLPPDPGFLLLALVGIVLVAVLADDLAFRRDLPVAALVPSLTVFVVVSLLGEGERARASLLYALAALGFVLVHLVAVEARRTWLPGDEGRGPGARLRVGAGVAVLAALAGVMLGPSLPGADDDPWWTWRGRGDGPRITISPLVDIQTRLVQQSDRVAFVVESDRPSYWRLTALDTFDGRIWRSSGSFSDADGDLPGAGTAPAERVPATQRFRVRALDAIWAPVAFEPSAVEPRGDAELSYDERSATLIVEELDTSDGLEYEAVSLLPRFTPDQLRAATGDVPGEVAERHLQLPADLSPVVADLAEEVTAGAPTGYDAALALQQWFRDEFTYSTEVAPGHDGSAVERFLTTGRVGYCEQFAGSFAAMARTLGIPSRVAVGFTPGEPEPLDDGTTRFTVRGEHAHAWPELWLPEVGWVPFEPTPSRGAPGAEPWTGVAPQQEGQAPTSTPSSVPTDAPDLPEPQIPDIDFGAFDDGGAGELPDLPGATGADEPVGDRLWWLVVAVPLGVAVVGGALAAARLARRARRRRRAGTDPTRRTLVAWADALDHLAVLELSPGRAETDREFARRAAPELGDDRDALVGLAAIVATARHRPGGVDDRAGRAAIDAAARVGDAVRARVPWPRRLARWVDPRPLLPRRPRRRRRAGAAVRPA
jgi:transglutaminase-like putative cysteine protease